MFRPPIATPLHRCRRSSCIVFDFAALGSRQGAAAVRLTLNLLIVENAPGKVRSFATLLHFTDLRMAFLELIFTTADSDRGGVGSVPLPSITASNKTECRPVLRAVNRRTRRRSTKDGWMQLALAPMEGLVDDVLRDVLTRVGGVDWCVTEFIRVNDQLLPPAVFHRLAPELRNGACTRAGTPMRVQLLGSNPTCLAENAALACTLGAPVIDLNFGCPAKTVNRSRGGAVLLKEPELLHRIVSEVRRAVPKEIPVTAKMRLGYDNTDTAFDCAAALADGGAAQIVVHARTKTDGYRPPAHWEWVARIQQRVRVPVFANGEIWSLEDWRRCREVSGAEHFMLGRGLVARPDLALQIIAAREGRLLLPMTWAELLPLVQDFWRQVRRKLPPQFAPGRLKQWLIWLARNDAQAAALFSQIRRDSDCTRIDALLDVNASESASLHAAKTATRTAVAA